MAKKIKSITGMNDILFDDMMYWHKLERVCHDVFARYGFSEIRTPLLEETGLFQRGIGEGSQVVQKEMYTFEDKGGDSVTLRPEGTASVVRAFVQHAMHAQESIRKLYYMGSMFRYERPQKGRLRQFHQIGAETLGVDSPLADAEVVIMMDRIWQELGLQNYELQINSIGTFDERQQYLQELKKYFEPHLSSLAEDDQKRFDSNTLRLLDSKDEKCIELAKGAPMILDHLTDQSRDEFETFKKMLNDAGVKFVVNPKIVRGLDYYEKTAFEFVSSALGSQSAFAGGGRYNRLVQELGGPEIPAVGFAMGCERVVMLMQDLPKGEQQLSGVFVAAMSETSFLAGRQLLQALRDGGLVAEMGYESKSLKAQMRRANKLGCQFVVILGDDEVQNKTASLKDFSDGSQTEVSQEQLVAEIKKRS